MITHSLPLSAGGTSWGLADHLKQRSSFVLLGLGILAVLLHASLRFPLRLPGHHGLEWMALLVLARQLSAYRWAATFAACGAAATALLPALGFHDALAPVTYLVPGLLVDLLWLAAPAARRNSTLFLGIAAALAYAAKPVCQWLGAEFFGLHFGALSQGLHYLIAMHMLFAFAGGSVSAWLWRRASARNSPR